MRNFRADMSGILKKPLKNLFGKTGGIPEKLFKMDVIFGGPLAFNCQQQ